MPMSLFSGIFFVSRFSSAEWRRTEIPNTTINKFNLANSLWFSMGSLMLQGSDDACPRYLVIYNLEYILYSDLTLFGPYSYLTLV